MITFFLKMLHYRIFCSNNSLLFYRLDKDMFYRLVVYWIDNNALYRIVFIGRLWCNPAVGIGSIYRLQESAHRQSGKMKNLLNECQKCVRLCVSIAHDKKQVIFYDNCNTHLLIFCALYTRGNFNKTNRCFVVYNSF